jgi:hypothetical protein
MDSGGARGEGEDDSGVVGGGVDSGVRGGEREREGARRAEAGAAGSMWLRFEVALKVLNLRTRIKACCEFGILIGVIGNQ